MAKGLHKAWRWSAYILAGIALILVLALWSAQYWLKGFIEDSVSSRTGRELRIGSLGIDWSLHPLVSVQDVHFANASWAERDTMLQAGQVQLRLSLPALLRGQLRIPALHIRDTDVWLQRGPEERANWELGPPQQDSGKSSLPAIERLHVRDTTVHYLEPDRDTDFQVAVRADPDADSAEGVTAKGNGKYRGESFKLEFQGNSPLDLLTPGDPYAMQLHVAAADTEATLKGQVFDPRALKASDLNLELTLAGPDPARLYKLVDLPLPSLPPYRVTGQLIREGKGWKLSGFDGSVGDSDLHGDIALSYQGDRPMLNAKLRSESLDFDDLGTLVGGSPGTGAGETAAPEQQRRRGGSEQSDRVLPQQEADLKQLRQIDADVQFQGDNVRAGKLPIDQVELHFILDQGKLRFDPLRFRAGGGNVDTQIVGDATGKQLDLKINGEFSKLNLQRLLADLDIANDSVGTIGGRAKLWMKGNSTAALLASTDGGVYLIMTGGRLDRVLVELAGLDIGEAILAKLGGGKQTIPINCGYADMQAKTGVLHLSDVIIDSTDTLFVADGTINLRTEQLDLQLIPKPKDVSLIAARSNLHIGGTLGDPKVRPGPATLLKGAASAALAAVAGPAAALVPLIETGGGQESASCRSFTDAVDAGAVGAQQ